MHQGIEQFCGRLQALGEKALLRLLSILQRIPFIGPAFSFPWTICVRSGREVAYLWILSSLPLLLSIGAKLLDKRSIADIAAEEVNIRAVFLYTSAFLAPVLFLMIESFIYPRKRKIFRGAHWIFLGTFLIWGASSWMYQNDKIPDIESSRFAAYAMYFASIYFWWLSIADNRNNEFPFESEVTKDENAFADMAARKR